MLLSLGVLVLTLGFNVLLSVSTLDSLATDSILSGYRSSGEHLAQSIERGMRFGKPLNSYAGMEEMLKDLYTSVESINLVEIVDIQGSLLYSQRKANTPSERFEGLQTRPADRKLITDFLSTPQKLKRKTLTGYRILIPLQNTALAGWVAMEVANEQVDAPTKGFLRWSFILMLATCTVVGLILTGWLGLLTSTEDARNNLHRTLGKLLLILIGGTQLVYSCGTLILFDSFVEQAVRTKASILAQSVERDFEYLIHKGMDVSRLKGKDLLLEQLVKNNEELKGAELLSPDGTILTSVGSLPDAGLVVEKPLNSYWPSRFRQRQEVMLLRLALDQRVITARILKLAIDMGTSLVISFLLLLELAKLIGLISSRSLCANVTEPKSAPHRCLSYSAQALRAAGFVFFLGYDMGISFIPLLARKLYQPLWSLSEEVVIGLPISAEMVSAGVALLISGSFSQRYGWHKTFISGTIAAALGLLIGGLATDLPILIVSRITAGFGFGLVLMAAQIGTLDDSQAGAGLASVFAGIFSGSICGSAAGAMLATHITFESVLLIGSIVILFAVRIALFGKTPVPHTAEQRFGMPKTDEPLVPQRSSASEESPAPAPTGGAGMTQKNGCSTDSSIFSGSLALLKDPRMHLMLLLIGIPVAICLTGFLLYLLPLLLTSAKVEQSDIGRVFMLYGLCFITVGPMLGRWIDRTQNKTTFLTLAGLLSGLSLLIAAKNFGIFGTAAAVVALGLAQCIAAPVTMLCILALNSAKALGRGKTASIYRALERIGQVIGPVLFGAATIAMEPRQVLLLMGSIVCALAVLFWVTWRISNSRS